MKIIGLTGGISTGKSTVSHFIATSQIKVIDADLIAREVVLPGTPAYYLILDHFGVKVLTETSKIDRAALGEIIFNNAEERNALNNITHPRIRVILLMNVIKAFLMGHSLIVLDTPLLFEAGLYRWVHATVVVYCPATIQLERLMARDNFTTAEAKARMDSQMDIDQKKSLAHHVIDNSGSMATTKQQVEKLLEELKPSPLTTIIMWVILFWPALFLYLFLHVYTKLDVIRNVGLLTSRPIPEIVDRNAIAHRSAAPAN